MDDHHDFGDFLQARRALITPQSAGLRGGGRRRVPGLRREELAQLAGISVEYYQRLEQGRAKHPSDEVLDALAEVLRLDRVEREHLHRLARPGRKVHPSSGPESDQVVAARPELVRLLEHVRVPAMVLSDRLDVLALNPVAKRLFVHGASAAPGSWNLAVFLFLAPEAREFYVEWDRLAADTVGQLRATAGRHPEDRRLARLIDRLRAESDTFQRLWSRADVEVRTHGTKSFRHPAVGTLTFTYETLDLSGPERQRLVTLTPVPNDPTEAALHLLTTWATDSTVPAARQPQDA
ncbi:helix-turn-helix transcriptional regulator [Kitasatospora purpeofusca]|uniref:helix-turn-helix transcriptional regulator n=1 Tax=Kitasatospora purpeofusca TaxID=67352 RepID=UPI002257A429|nr:helix-turn-helix transcriptional regulator [Kitasatospora purpeofusca]MCX4752058.1 helix-turn-helix transcriptional regulator [Kitasatospora purpeofusca]WSR31661.1 helix-turn-helix transcriptional regulator [Kitasatospora purpeofusca]